MRGTPAARRSARWCRIAVFTCLAGPLGACVIVHEDARDTTRSDTVVDLSTFVPDSPRARPEPVTDGGEVADSMPAVTSGFSLAMLSAELIIPLPGVQPSELRDTFHEPRGGGTRLHEALDIMAPRGTPVYSAAPGRVLKLHNSKDGGLMVYAADSSDQYVLMYAHLDRYAAGLRDDLPLERGQVIGYVGTTGNAPPNAPHLHFAIAHPASVKLWWTGEAIDPRPLLQRPAPVH
jgi:murein DD-endopeptidase MepM/ murein hydrolase activator NlpD